MSERQSQIVDAAMQIIATKGSRRFTAQLLATEIGVTGGAIYRHFESMDAIVDAVVQRMGAILFDGFPPELSDPIERLKVFFHHRARTILVKPHISRLLLSDHLAQAGGRVQARRLKEFKRRSQAFVVACLREAQQDGELSGDISPEAGAVIVLGSILSLSHASARLAGEGKIERLFDEVWSAIERTLRGQRPSGALKEQPRRQRRRGNKGDDLWQPNRNPRRTRCPQPRRST
jgi:AcrR family transcriptional regulator